MRTIVDLPQDQIDQMTALGKRENLSRAELVRRAVAEYLSQQPLAADDAAFGIWRHNQVDGLALQRTLRDEWE